MKRKINVIDLDKTLIPYDSFGMAVKMEIYSFNLVVFYHSILRITRIITLKKFKEKITNLLEKKYKEAFFKEFALKLYSDLDKNVLNEIQNESDNETINILLSASPNLYVKFLIEKLGWIGSGSYFNAAGEFIHLHGIDKINWIEQNFRSHEFEYNMAISDSSTDDKLLTLFRRKIKWTLP